MLSLQCFKFNLDSVIFIAIDAVLGKRAPGHIARRFDRHSRIVHPIDGIGKLILPESILRLTSLGSLRKNS
jgi:hypothetical protein